jgi:hypothetical protein
MIGILYVEFWCYSISAVGGTEGTDSIGDSAEDFKQSAIYRD